MRGVDFETATRGSGTAGTLGSGWWSLYGPRVLVSLGDAGPRPGVDGGGCRARHGTRRPPPHTGRIGRRLPAQRGKARPGDLRPARRDPGRGSVLRVASRRRAAPRPRWRHGPAHAALHRGRGEPPSAIRARVVATFVLAAKLLGRQVSPLHFTTTMLAAVLAYNPLLVYSSAFQLSVAAVFGILLLRDPLNALVERTVLRTFDRPPRAVCNLISAPLRPRSRPPRSSPRPSMKSPPWAS